MSRSLRSLKRAISGPIEYQRPVACHTSAGCATGIVISEIALPQLGIQIPRAMAWRGIHGLASDAGVIILGLHLGLHWQWLVGTISRHVVKPVISLFHRPARREEVLS